MAKIEIDLGTNVDASWTKQIVYRNGNGEAWHTIYTDGLSVEPHMRTVPAQGPLMTSKYKFMISLIDKSDHKVLVFDLAEVSNQPTWTATGTVTDVKNAVIDLTTWIAATSASLSFSTGLFSLSSSGASGISPLTYRTTNLLNVGQVAKASEGNVYGYSIINLTNAVRYIKFYDSAAPVIGTTPVVETIKLPALGSIVEMSPVPIMPHFTTAISFLAVTGPGDAAAVAPAANTIIAHVKYR